MGRRRGRDRDCRCVFPHVVGMEAACATRRHEFDNRAGHQCRPWRHTRYLEGAVRLEDQDIFGTLNAGITTSQLTIDKVVERGGLTVIEWRMVGDTGVRDVSSFFRLSTNERNSLLASLTNVQKPKVKEIL